ncbi:hypothetical protein ENBRE01_0189 [Enteropsectra breve]|nr:hypothetical protein ENBRE01_0189 [Enteropsectra breve]
MDSAVLKNEELKFTMLDEDVENSFYKGDYKFSTQTTVVYDEYFLVHDGDSILKIQASVDKAFYHNKDIAILRGGELTVYSPKEGHASFAEIQNYSIESPDNLNDLFESNTLSSLNKNYSYYRAGKTALKISDEKIIVGNQEFVNKLGSNCCFVAYLKNIIVIGSALSPEFMYFLDGEEMELEEMECLSLPMDDDFEPMKLLDLKFVNNVLMIKCDQKTVYFTVKGIRTNTQKPGTKTYVVDGAEIKEAEKTAHHGAMDETMKEHVLEDKSSFNVEGSISNLSEKNLFRSKLNLVSSKNANENSQSKPPAEKERQELTTGTSENSTSPIRSADPLATQQKETGSIFSGISSASLNKAAASSKIDLFGEKQPDNPFSSSSFNLKPLDLVEKDKPSFAAMKSATLPSPALNSEITSQNSLISGIGSKSAATPNLSSSSKTIGTPVADYKPKSSLENDPIQSTDEKKKSEETLSSLQKTNLSKLKNTLGTKVTGLTAKFDKIKPVKSGEKSFFFYSPEPTDISELYTVIKNGKIANLSNRITELTVEAETMIHSDLSNVEESIKYIDSVITGGAVHRQHAHYSAPILASSRLPRDAMEESSLLLEKLSLISVKDYLPKHSAGEKQLRKSSNKVSESNKNRENLKTTIEPQVNTISLKSDSKLDIKESLPSKQVTHNDSVANTRQPPMQEFTPAQTPLMNGQPSSLFGQQNFQNVTNPMFTNNTSSIFKNIAELGSASQNAQQSPSVQTEDSDAGGSALSRLVSSRRMFK